jgi:2-oxoglutarate dehydrogenase E2 component (dihydrolipoamide succinyltransferase)
MAWIGQPGEALDAESDTGAPAPTVQPAAAPSPSTQPAATVASAPVTAAKPVTVEYQGYVSPLVKKLVALNNVDLNLVQGTGQDGRITKEDVQHYLETRKSAPQGIVGAASPAPAVPTAASVSAAPASPSAGMLGELIPHTSLRKQIAERMVNSVHTSPHVMTVMEADLSKVMAHRAANKAAFAAGGVNLTLTAYFSAAIIAGLKACPYVNSSWTDEGIQYHSAINLGIATALEDGLIVPVIKNAELLSLQGLAQSINDLSGRARAKRLLPDEVKGGTFTLTNNGSGGSLFASPIILQPQAGILGTGIMQKRAVVITDAAGNDAIAIRPMIYLSFVFDHRIMDGETGDRFLKAVKNALENWA